MFEYFNMSEKLTFRISYKDYPIELVRYQVEQRGTT